MIDRENRFQLLLIMLSGADGSLHDSAVYRKTKLHQMTNNSINIWPTDKKLPNSNTLFPHYFVGDAAFPLSTRLQRPYPGKSLNKEKEIFNYRLSRARRTIENTFGVFSSRWRIFYKPIIARKRTVRLIVAASVCLHNFLMEENADYPITHPLHSLNIIRSEDSSKASTNSTKGALKLRDILCNYVNTDGAVSWQFDRVNAYQPQIQ